jgi:hypothetical protein
MPKYRVIRTSYLRANGESVCRIYKPGALIDYDEPPGLSLEPLDEAAREAMRRWCPQYQAPNFVPTRTALGNQH